MQANYFKWFNLPESYLIDLNLLQDKYYALSKQVHPDNFHHKSNLEKQLAEQALEYSHQAYEVLCCPVKRASYILLLNQFDLNSENIQQKPLDPDFLERIFEWKTKAAFDETQKTAIKKELETSLSTRIHQIADLYQNQAYEPAVPLVREMLFIQKMLEQA